MTAPAAEQHTIQLPTRIAIKALNINHANSEETWCFSASVYVDGTKAGTVRNHGHGGPDIFEWTDPALGKIAEQIGDEYYPSTYGSGLEVLIGDLVNEANIVKTAKQNAKRGYPITAVIETGRYEVPATDTSKGFTGYGHTHVVGLQSEAALDEALAHYKGERYRLVHV